MFLVFALVSTINSALLSINGESSLDCVSITQCLKEYTKLPIKSILISAGTIEYSDLSTISPVIPNIENIVFDESVILLGNYLDVSFANSASLTTFICPQLTILSPGAFENCISLNIIKLDNCVIMHDKAFSGCSSLAEATFPRLRKIISSTDEGCHFKNCEKLTVIDMPLLNYIDARFGFIGCHSLKTIILPQLKTIRSNTFSQSNITDVHLPKLHSVSESAFSDCLSLATAYLPELSDISDSLFSGCISLNNLTAGNAVNIGQNSFSSCSSIENINFSRASDVGSSSFNSCSSLKNVSISMASRVGSNAFQSCSELEDLDIRSNRINNADIISQCIKLVRYITGIFNINFNQFRETKIRKLSFPNVYYVSYQGFYGSSAIESIEMPKVSEIEYRAFSGCINIKSIEFPMLTLLKSNSYAGVFDSMTSLESLNLPNLYLNGQEDAFYNNINLAYVDVPKLYEVEKRSLFRSCIGLTNISLPSLTYTISNEFEGCKSLKELDCPNLQGVKDYCLYQCGNLTDFYAPLAETLGISSLYGCISLENIEFPSVIKIYRYALSSCSKLKNVSLPNFRYGQSQTTGGSTYCQFFLNCNNLETISLPNLIYMDGRETFKSCSSLKDVDLPRYCRGNAQYCFTECNSLADIEIPHITAVCTRMFSSCSTLSRASFPRAIIIYDEAFYQESYLKEIYAPNIVLLNSYAMCQCSSIRKVSFPNLRSIEYFAFSDCSILTDVDLPNLIYLTEGTWGGISRGYVFQNCLSLEKICLPKVRETRGRGHFQGCTSLKTIELEQLTKVDGDYFAANCDSLIEVTFPSLPSFNTRMFDSCNNLRIINAKRLLYISNTGLYSLKSLKNIDAPNLISCGTYAIASCSSLEQIDFPKLCIILEYCFNGCESLVSINTPNLVTGNGGSNDDGYYFGKCYSLETIDLPNLCCFNSGRAFYNCTSLYRVKLPKLSKAGTYTFTYCSNLVSVELPSIGGIKYEMFTYCTLLKSVNAPYSQFIEERAFFSTNIDSVIAPHVKFIQTNAFNRCSKLVDVDFPELTYITNYIFYSCSSLKNVKLDNLMFIEGSQIFELCASLEKLELPNLRSIVGERFLYDCKNLKEVNFPKLKNTGDKMFHNTVVKKLRLESLIDTQNGHFTNCLIEEIDFPSLVQVKDSTFYNLPIKLFSGENIKVLLASSFSGCSSLTSINLPNLLVINQYSFKSCVSLVDISLPKLLLSIGNANNNNAFTLCTNLASFSAPMLKSIQSPYMFDQCSSLREIHLANCYEIANYAFNKCINLNKANLPKLVMIEKNLFEQCTSLTYISAPNSVKFSSQANLCQSLEEIETGVNIINVNDFYLYSRLKTALFPRAIVVDSSAFKGCQDLSTIYLPVVISFAGIEHFSMCSSLKTIDLKTLKDVSSDNSDLFLSCPLDEIYFGSIPPFVFNNMAFSDKSVVIKLPKLADYVFYDNCVAITGDIKNDSKWCKVELIGLMIYIKINDGDIVFGENLKQVTDSISQTITSIEIVKGKLSAADFNNFATNYPSLKTLIINESVIMEDGIPDNTFTNNEVIEAIDLGPIKEISSTLISTCTNLISVKGPCVSTIKSGGLNSLKITEVEFPQVTMIESNVFDNCAELIRISLPMLQTIQGTTSISNCNKLEFVSIPSLATIDINCNWFKDINLKTLVLGSTPPNKYGFQFTNSDIDLQLPHFEDYLTYDQDAYGEDTSTDLKWRNIILKPLKFSMIVNDNKVCYGENFNSALTSCSIQPTSVSSIDITNGKVSLEDFTNIKTCTNIQKFSISLHAEATSIPESTFQNFASLDSLNIEFVTELGKNSFARSSVRDIVLPDVSEIGEGAFSGCNNIVTLDLPKIKRINNSAFANCEKLLTVSMPLVEFIGNSGFSNCIKLNTIGDTPSLLQIGDNCLEKTNFATFVHPNLREKIGAFSFSSCPSITEITIPFVQSVGANAFEKCSLLSAIDISSATIIPAYVFNQLTKLASLKADSATELDESAFSGCTTIRSIDLPSVKTIVGNTQFKGCAALMNLSLTKLEIVNVDNDNIFQDCASLRRIYFGSIPPKTFHKDAFVNLIKLEIILPDSVDYFNFDNDISIAGDVVADLKWGGVALKTMRVVLVKINEFDQVTTNSIDGAVKRAGITNDQVTTIVVSNLDFKELSNPSMTEVYKELTYFEIQGSSDSDSIIPSRAFEFHPKLKALKLSGTKEISYSSFARCQSLETVELISVEKIGRNAFYDCTSLTSVTDLMTSSIDDLAFYSCISLETVSFSALKAISIKCFSGCTKLETLMFPEVTLINQDAFYQCQMLTDVSFAKLTTVSSSLFFGLKNLSNVYMPSLKNIQSYGFSECPSLESLSFPVLDNMGERAFANCLNLVNFSAPMLTKIDGFGFYECISLQNVEMNMLKTCGDNVFAKCSNIVSIDLPALTTIGKFTFTECNELERINAPLLSTFGTRSFTELPKLIYVNISSVKTLIANVFSDCVNLETVDVQSTTKITGDYHFANCSKISEIRLPKLTSVESAPYIFFNCHMMRNIYLGSVPPKTFHPLVFANRFSEFVLTFRVPVLDDHYTYDNNVDIPGDVKGDEKWAGLPIPVLFTVIVVNGEHKSRDISIDKAVEAAGFSATSGQYLDVTSLFVENGKLMNEYLIDNGRNMWDRYPNLLNFTVSSTVNIDLSEIPANSFSNHEKLKYFDIPQLNTIKDRALFNCVSLTSIKLPALQTLGNSVMEGCTNLESINLPSVVSISSRTFAGCIKLSTITIAKATTLKDGCFEGCVGLKIFKLEGITTIDGDNIFKDCLNLEDLYLTKLKYVSSNSANIFKNCPKLDKIHFPTTPPHVFHPDTFKNRGSSVSNPLVFSSLNPFYTYDDDDSIVGDTKFDCMWCGISFYNLIGVHVSVNNKAPVLGNNLETAISNSEVDVVESINVTGGHLFKNDFIYSGSAIIGTRYPSLRTFSIIDGVIVDDNTLYENALKSSPIREAYIHGISILGDNCFSRCNNLIHIEAPDLVRINYACFSSCSSLVEIDLDVKVLGSSAFSNCQLLEIIKFNYLEIINNYAFEKCYKLKEIYFPSVTNVYEHIFKDCNVERITMPKLSKCGVNSFRELSKLVEFYSESITEIGAAAFYLDKELTIADVPSTTIIGHSAFMNCEKLETFTSSIVTEIAYKAFSGCLALTNCSFEATKVIEYEAFKNCRSLKSFVNHRATYIQQNAFNGCSTLKRAEFSEMSRIYENCFQNCYELVKFVAPKTVQLENSVFSGCSMLEVPNFGVLNKCVNNCFEGCNAFLKIQFPLLTEIGEYCFKDCLNLESVSLNKLTKMKRYAFVGCQSLGNVSFDKITTVESYCFFSLKNLINVYIPIVTLINNYAFSECSNITGFDFSQLETIGEGAFKDCTSLNDFDISSISNIGKKAFMGCESIRSLNFSSLTTINEQTFSGTGLENVSLPNTVIIDTEAFAFCENLLSVEAPSLTTLTGSGNFKYCENLEVINCQQLKTVNSSAPDILENCKNLQKLYLNPTPPSRFHKDVFINMNSISYLEIVLNSYDDYITYDNSEEYITNNGDKANDKKFNQIPLTELYTKAIINNRMFIGATLDECATASSIQPQDIKSIRIMGGVFSVYDYVTEENKTITDRFPALESFETSTNMHIADLTIPEYTFANHLSLKSVTIGRSKELNGHVFENCVSLETVMLINVNKITSTDFEGCVKLHMLQINNLAVIPEYAFENLTSLKTFVATSVSTIESYSFNGCSIIEVLEFRNLKKLDGNGQFKDCRSLNSINLGNSTTSSLVVSPDNHDIFENCDSLAFLYLQGKYVPSTFSNQAFTNRKNEIEIRLMLQELEDYYRYDDDVSVTGDTDKDGRWDNILLRQILTVAKVNGVESYSTSLDETALKVVDSLEKVITLEVTDGKLETTDFVDSNDRKMTRFSKLEKFAVNEIVSLKMEELPQNCFENHITLKSVEVNNIKKFSSSLFKGCANLENISIPMADSIPASAFANLQNLKFASFESALLIEQSAFNGCSSLQEVNAQKVNNIDINAFTGCSSELFEEINFPELLQVKPNLFKEMKITIAILTKCSEIGSNAFLTCSNLVDISIPSVVAIREYAFMNCESLKEIVANKLITLEIDVFKGCTLLEHVEFNILTVLISETFKGRENLMTVTILTLGSTGSETFYGCIKLVSISFPVLSNIGSKVFYNCKELKNVYLPELEETAEECFVGCDALEEIELPSLLIIKQKTFFELPSLRAAKFNVAQLTEDSAFESCESLVDIQFPEMQELKDRCLYSCSSVKSIVVDKVTTIGSQVFEECESLQFIEFPLLNVAGVSCFMNCISLEYAHLSKCSLVNREFFINCISLVEVDISNAKSLEEFCFFNCTSLSNITGPCVESFNGINHFQWCINLEKISFLSLLKTNKENSGLFLHCDNLESIYFPSNPPKAFNEDTFKFVKPALILPAWDDYYTYDNSILINNDILGDCYWCGLFFEFLVTRIRVNKGPEVIGNALSTAVVLSHEAVIREIEVIGGKINGTDFILHGENMYQQFPDLTNFTLIEGVKVQLEANNVPSRSFAGHQMIEYVFIDVIDTIGDFCFDQCTNVKSIELPKLTKQFSKAFIGCSELHSIKVPLMTEIPEEAFIGLRSLALIEAPIMTKINAKAFSGCESLVSFNFPLVEYLGDNCFEKCYKLKSVDFPNINHNFNDVFIDCTSLETVIMENIETIPARAFMNLPKLKEIVAPNISSAEEHAFYGCSSIESIEFKQLEHVGDHCFEKCTSLKSVELPAMESIESSFIFADCSSLETVSLMNLKTVNNTCLGIFDNCLNLKALVLPSNPPSSFHGSTFIGLEKVELILPDLSDFFTYDKFTDAKGEIEGDAKWMSIVLHKIVHFVTINSLEAVTSSSIKYAAILSNISFDEVINITITGGVLFDSDYTSFAEFFNARTVIISGVEIDLIPDYTFSGLSSLQELVIHDANQVGSNNFENCANLETVDLKDTTELIGEDHFKLCESLKIVKLNSLQSISKSNQEIFKGCVNLEILELGCTIPTGFASQLFTDCKRLELVLPQLTCYYEYDNDERIEGDIVGDCYWGGIYLYQIARKLIINNVNETEGNSIANAIKLSEYDLKDVSSIKIVGGILDESDFINFSELAPNLVSFAIEADISITIPTNSFSGHNKIREVVVSSFVSIGDSCFANCENLLNFEFTQRKNAKLNADESRIGSRAFMNCISLKVIDLSKVTNLGEEAFIGCKSLEEISLIELKALNKATFKNCISLETIGLDSLTTLNGDEHFSGCLMLRNISLVSLLNVDENSENIFYDCRNLVLIELGPNPPKTFNQNIFKNRNSELKITLVVPDESDYENYDDDGDGMWLGISIRKPRVSPNAPNVGPDDDQENKSNTGLIAGCAVGGVVVVVAIIVVVLVLIKKKKKGIEGSSSSVPSI